MLVNHLQKLLRLYRNTAIVLLGCVVIEGFGLNILGDLTSSQLSKLIAVGGFSGIAIAAAEMTRWLLQRMDAHFATQEDPTVPHAFHVLSTGLLAAQWGFLAVIALWTQWPWIISLLALSVASACFICRTKVAITLAAGSLIVLAIQGVLIHSGLPATPKAQSLWAVLITSLQSGLTLLVWFQLGHYIATLVASSNHQVNRLQSLATTDTLTGLINRRLLMHQFQAEFSRARRHQTSLSVAMFDIDHFKKVNDIYGHQVGDRILKELGALIHENVRDCDTVGRYGGEEFCLILPETRQTEAADLMERLRIMVERHVFCMPDNPLTVTISVGLAQLEHRTHHTKEDLILQADAALYEAKQQGRNKVVYGVLPVPKISYTSASQRMSGQLF